MRTSVRTVKSRLREVVGSFSVSGFGRREAGGAARLASRDLQRPDARAEPRDLELHFRTPLGLDLSPPSARYRVKWRRVRT